ncbi:MAG: NAD-dependent protein deacetylase [Gammaproteobacteria bacterium]|nr:NAD-dependent protein deacetylase [Gammaproteobacteria bacterium]MBT8106259.1 NAD-dependent protein deacetylase [Gammaproteobacteria bacterium]NNF50112.1 NAD-dependent protein deacetylase [Woeseiaceae bacterium]NNK26273.1 NAD-dependent protein deacetylase [Woeseiaceae bacterium]NNL62965.1 NAD-dependent protein deacetylase [Woeseiaceae bacterium]
MYCPEWVRQSRLVNRMNGSRDIDSLRDFLAEQDSVVVLTGAGVSTASGIPDYRDRNGEWKQREPMQFGEFKASDNARKRYWARSYAGWTRFSVARPNAAHEALAHLESSGKVDTLITQNVDGLHGQAGSRNVIDLHGRLAWVRCIDCNTAQDRHRYQEALRQANPHWDAKPVRYNADGDAVLEASSHEQFSVPGCPECGGTVKPDVVMFGESVPKSRVQRALDAIDRARALLVVGSSLMVYSGFRFARYARAGGIPIAIVNLGRTRADDIATLKIDGDCGTVLPMILQQQTA